MDIVEEMRKLEAEHSTECPHAGSVSFVVDYGIAEIERLRDGLYVAIAGQVMQIKQVYTEYEKAAENGKVPVIKIKFEDDVPLMMALDFVSDMRERLALFDAAAAIKVTFEDGEEERMRDVQDNRVGRIE
jgi:hypothetical protein